MTNPFEPPRSDCTPAAESPGACPGCGRGISAMQYIFNPKLNRVRCRQCRSELTYRIPLAAKLIFFAAGLTVGPLATVPLLLGLHPVWCLVVLAVGFVLFSHVEARYILDHYPAETVER